VDDYFLYGSVVILHTDNNKIKLNLPTADAVTNTSGFFEAEAIALASNLFV